VVADFGMISLLADLEVIAEPEAGPLVGPLIVAIAAVALFLCFLRASVRPRPAWQTAISAAFATYAAQILGGAIVITYGRGTLDDFFDFVTEYVSSPFFISAALLAGLVAFGFVAAARYQEAGRNRPRWPWEDPFDE
jgi:hypothetical protein